MVYSVHHSMFCWTIAIVCGSPRIHSTQLYSLYMLCVTVILITIFRFVLFRQFNTRILKLMLRYPLCCIRTLPVQCFPRVDLQGVLRTFLSDLQAELLSVCGFPVQMSNKPFYYNHELIRPVSEVLHRRVHKHTFKHSSSIDQILRLLST